MHDHDEPIRDLGPCGAAFELATLRFEPGQSLVEDRERTRA